MRNPAVAGILVKDKTANRNTGIFSVVFGTPDATVATSNLNITASTSKDRNQYMNKLLMDLQKEFQKLKNNIKIPKEIERLYQWIEDNGLSESYDNLVQLPKNIVGDPTVYQYGRINVNYEFSVYNVRSALDKLLVWTP